MLDFIASVLNFLPFVLIGPVHSWFSNGYWHARWGGHGKVCKSKSRKAAEAKAAKQGAAAHANGYKGE